MFSSMAPWQILTLIGVALAVAEVFVPGFVVLPIGMAFLLTAAASLVVSGWGPLLVILMVSQLGVFWAFRHFFKGKLNRPRAYTGAEGMIGAECVVTEEITPAQPGYVKLYGDRWQALTHHTSPITVGTRVVIVKIDGNKVVVEPNV